MSNLYADLKKRMIAVAKDQGLRDIATEIVDRAIELDIKQSDEGFISFCRGAARAFDIVSMIPKHDMENTLVGHSSKDTGHLVTHAEGQSWTTNVLMSLCRTFVVEGNWGMDSEEAIKLWNFFINDPFFGDRHVDESFDRDDIYILFRYYVRGYWT